MRITTPNTLATVVRGTRKQRPERGHSRTLRQRVNAYTLWAFNPQRELTSRYDRAA